MSQINDPAVRQRAVTKSDSTSLNLTGIGLPRAIWVGTGGNIAIVAAGDSSPVTIVNVANGTRLDIQAEKVMSTNTTASDIVAWY